MFTRILHVHGIASVALVAMMLIVVGDVVLRAVFNTPLRGAYDLVSIALLVMVFFGIGPVVVMKREILIDLIDGAVKPIVLRALKTLPSVLTLAVGDVGACHKCMAMGRPFTGTRSTSLAFVAARLCRIGGHSHLRRTGVAEHTERAGLMSSFALGLTGIALMFGLLILRQPVWLALALCGIVGNALLNSVSMTKFVTGTGTFDLASSYALSVIPLFVLPVSLCPKWNAQVTRKAMPPRQLPQADRWAS